MFFDLTDYSLVNRYFPHSFKFVANFKLNISLDLILSKTVNSFPTAKDRPPSKVSFLDNLSKL